MYRPATPSREKKSGKQAPPVPYVRHTRAYTVAHYHTYRTYVLNFKYMQQYSGSRHDEARCHVGDTRSHCRVAVVVAAVVPAGSRNKKNKNSVAESSTDYCITEFCCAAVLRASALYQHSYFLGDTTTSSTAVEYHRSYQRSMYCCEKNRESSPLLPELGFAWIPPGLLPPHPMLSCSAASSPSLSLSLYY